jgi:hypothetical protein
VVLVSLAITTQVAVVVALQRLVAMLLMVNLVMAAPD